MQATTPVMDTSPPTSPLDILCKVAAAEGSNGAPPVESSPVHRPLPPMLPPMTPPDRPPPFAPLAPTEPVMHHHVHHHHHHMHAPPRPAFRLSSSAPTYPSTLSAAGHLPLPSPPFGGGTPPTNPPLAHVPSIQRNASAPVLGGLHAWHPPPAHMHTHHHVILPEPGARSHSGAGSRSSSSAVPVPARLPSRFAPLPSMHIPPLPRSAPPSYGVSPPCASSPPLRGTGALKSMGRKATGRRDSYTRFTAEEEAMLLEGVRVFGVGNWKKILNSYQFHWKRTAVDLKDKYRNITRAKMRRMNASTVGSQSDLSSVGSEGDSALSPPTVNVPVMQCSVLQPPAINASSFSPVSTPSGSVDGPPLERRITAISGVMGRPGGIYDGSSVDKKDHTLSG